MSAVSISAISAASITWLIAPTTGISNQTCIIGFSKPVFPFTTGISVVLGSISGSYSWNTGKNQVSFTYNAPTSLTGEVFSMPTFQAYDCTIGFGVSIKAFYIISFTPPSSINIKVSGLYTVVFSNTLSNTPIINIPNGSLGITSISGSTLTLYWTPSSTGTFTLSFTNAGVTLNAQSSITVSVLSTKQLPNPIDATTVFATTSYNSAHIAYLAVKPTTIVTDSWENNSWIAGYTITSNQKYGVMFNTEFC